MMKGVQAYRAHPYERVPGDTEILWQEGSVKLLALQEADVARDTKKDVPVILLIPSLINRAFIFDLKKERSFLRWLNGQGAKAYLLDWGELSEDQDLHCVEDVIEKYLLAATRYLAEKEGRPVHALGYCLGGTLLVGAAAHTPSLFSSLTLLAAPWDFHAGSQALLKRVQFWTLSALQAIDVEKKMPPEWVQALFASLDPMFTVEKFSKFSQMDQGAEEAELFVAVEDWLNDGVALPAGVAKECIENWFLKNETGEEAWCISGQNVGPQNLPMPVCVVTSRKDRLVEYETAIPLAKNIPGAEILDPECGHIGMIAGRNSVENVWPKILDFIYRHDTCKVPAA
ncbi:MAG: alpha/beta fold hydrolase [Alphaproteobacteria bacterium]|nr:alpha/beta fold hydrolase [Alphaproteobacteria bacterium]